MIPKTRKINRNNRKRPADSVGGALVFELLPRSAKGSSIYERAG